MKILFIPLLLLSVSYTNAQQNILDGYISEAFKNNRGCTANNYSWRNPSLPSKEAWQAVLTQY